MYWIRSSCIYTIIFKTLTKNFQPFNSHKLRREETFELLYVNYMVTSLDFSLKALDQGLYMAKIPMLDAFHISWEAVMENNFPSTLPRVLG